MDLGVGKWIAVHKQFWRVERTCICSAYKVEVWIKDQFLFSHQLVHLCLYTTDLVVRRECSHAHTLGLRITNHGLLQARNHRLLNRRQQMFRHHGTTNSRTFLSCLHRHFVGQFTHKKGKLRIFWLHIWTQHRSVQTICFQVKRHRALVQMRKSAQHLTGSCRTCEGHDVLKIYVV